MVLCSQEKTNRGWGSRGTKPYAVQRLNWTGKTPFEVLEMKAAKGGFELVFTQPVDRELAANVKSYGMRSFTYIFQGAYGSPEVDETKPTIRSAKVSEDGLRVTLEVEGLQRETSIICNRMDYDRRWGFLCCIRTPITHSIIWWNR